MVHYLISRDETLRGEAEEKVDKPSPNLLAGKSNPVNAGLISEPEIHVNEIAPLISN